MIPPSIPCILSSGFWVIIFLHTQIFVPSKLGYDRETLESKFFLVQCHQYIWAGVVQQCLVSMQLIHLPAQSRLMQCISWELFVYWYQKSFTERSLGPQSPFKNSYQCSSLCSQKGWYSFYTCIGTGMNVRRAIRHVYNLSSSACFNICTLF